MGEGALAMVNSLLLDRSKWFFPSRNHGFSHKRWGGSSNSSLKLRWTMEISATSSVFYRFQPAHEAWQNRPGPLLLLPFWCYAVCGSTSRGDGGSSESTCGWWSLNWMTQGFVCGLGCQHIVYNYVVTPKNTPVGIWNSWPMAWLGVPQMFQQGHAQKSPSWKADSVNVGVQRLPGMTIPITLW